MNDVEATAGGMAGNDAVLCRGVAGFDGAGGFLVDDDFRFGGSFLTAFGGGSDLSGLGGASRFGVFETVEWANGSGDVSDRIGSQGFAAGRSSVSVKEPVLAVALNDEVVGVGTLDSGGCVKASIGWCGHWSYEIELVDVRNSFKGFKNACLQRNRVSTEYFGSVFVSIHFGSTPKVFNQNT